ncbi:MAG TPA: hypothetical protein VHR66_27160 [Gemmataceae bacterium]|jgi:hypothetical protein|nr:hypothetical protein [Gemmataceae bacterium]
MSDVTILISSFDRYSDCWQPVCHGFQKYWRDCPWPVLLMTNEKDFDHPAARVLKVRGGADWSARMIDALDRIESPYVMYFQEDYWLTEPVDTPRILEYFRLMQEHGLNYLRFLAYPAPAHDFEPDPRLGRIGVDGAYRTSVQITLWRREVFRDLVRDGETVWQFEIRGTERSRKYGDTFVAIRPNGKDEYANGIRYVCTAVNAGKWARMAKAYAAREGLAVDFSNLPSDTWWDGFKRWRPVGPFVVKWLHRAKTVLLHPTTAFRKARAKVSR